jgi:hypothetical protein
MPGNTLPLHGEETDPREEAEVQTREGEPDPPALQT